MYQFLAVLLILFSDQGLVFYNFWLFTIVNLFISRHSPTDDVPISGFHVDFIDMITPHAICKTCIICKSSVGYMLGTRLMDGYDTQEFTSSSSLGSNCDF